MDFTKEELEEWSKSYDNQNMGICPLCHNVNSIVDRNCKICFYSFDTQPTEKELKDFNSLFDIAWDESLDLIGSSEDFTAYTIPFSEIPDHHINTEDAYRESKTEDS